MAVNLAKFSIDGDPAEDGSGNRGYDATSGQTLDLVLENPSVDILLVTYAVNDTSNPSSPQKSLSAPAITFSGAVPTKSPVNPGDTVSITLPVATIAHSWVIRCTVITAGGDHVFERLVSIRSATASLRKTVPAETTHYEARGWSDEQNRMVDAISGGVSPSGGSLIQIHQEYASTVAHYRLQDTAAEADVLIDSVNAQNITKDANGNNFPGPTFPGGMRLTKVGGLTFAYLDRCRHDVANTALYLQGAMTCVFLGSRAQSWPSNGGWILYGVSGQNTQYAFEAINDGTLRYWHHTGAAVVQEHIVRWNAPADLFWLGFTRTSGGVVQIWMNGKKVGSPSAALTMPTGGTGAKFHFVNSTAAGVTSMHSWMASLRIDNVVLSDATLKADYNHTLGNMHGYVL